MELVFNEEEQAKIDAIKAARAIKAKERDVAADEAHKKHLFGHAGGDEMRLIVFALPPVFGGKAIYKVPIDEQWATLQKQSLDAIIKDKKGTPASAAAFIAQRHDLLLYPSLSELQAWRDEIPGLYMKIKDAFESRCDDGQAVTGK